MDPGPHAALVAVFAGDDLQCGLRAYTTNCLVAAARHFCAWAHLTGRSLDGDGEVLVQEFAEHDCHCGGPRRGGSRSRRYLSRVERFVRFLVAEGVLSGTPAALGSRGACCALSRLGS